MKENNAPILSDNIEEKLRSIFIAAPVGIGIVSNRVILEANETLCRMTGYSKAEMIGRNASFLYPSMEEYNFVGSEKYGQIQRTGSGTVETRWVKKDGSIIDIILSSAPIDRDVLSKGVTFTALDITERKKTEKALTESEHRLMTYMENSPEAIFIANTEGILQEVNRQAAEMTGYRIDELYGKHIKKIHVEEELSMALGKFEEVLKTGKVRFEFRLKCKDNRAIPVLMDAGILPDGRVIGYCRDISDRKQKDDMLLKYSGMIKNITMNIPAILYQYNVRDDFSGFTFLNEKAETVFEIDIRRPDYLDEYREHVHPDYRDNFNRTIDESINNKTPWFCEWPFIHKSGEVRWYRGISNPEFKENELVFYGVIHDITREKQTQMALISSESRYRELVELAVDGIMTASSEGIISDSNSSAEIILGIKKENYIGRHISSLFTPEDIRNNPLRLDILRSGQIGISEREVFKGDGSIARVEIHSRMMPDGSFQAIFQDITLRKKNEEALAASESKYRELVELAVDGILLGSNDGLITGVNSQLEKMTGRTREELLGRHIRELFTEESIDKRPLRFDLLKDGETVINERVLKRNDSITVIVESHSRMMPDGKFQAIVRDVTERKRSEEALAAEKERLAVTLRSIGDGVIATDTEGNIQLMNSVAEKLTGWNFDECNNKNISDIFITINEFTREMEPGIIKKIISRGDVVELSTDTILVSKNGKEILISDSGAPIKDSSGTVTGAVIVFRDMTEKRRLTESLQRAQKLDSLATLAGGIAHDFNNMLGGMLGYIDLARNYSRSSEDIAAYLDKTMTVFDRAKNLTGQLMTFARGGDPSMQTGSIIPVLKEFTESALKGSDIQCSFSLPDDLWLTDFDRDQIGQVIFNIATNAREFMTAGGVIKISAENTEIESSNMQQLKPGKYIRIEVEDCGKGIPSDMLPHIFDPFFTTKTKGNGLGLSTSYSIILRHGGSLDVESVYGRGSRFWFHLPAILPSEQRGTVTGAAIHSGQGKVLIMDDEYFIREIISQMLEHMGYEVIQTPDGNAMIEKFMEYHCIPDLRFVVLDLTIPGGMGGRDTVAEIRKINRDIPVFASSGYSNDKVMADPRTYGFTDSIRKPFTVNELSELLNRHLTQ